MIKETRELDSTGTIVREAVRWIWMRFFPWLAGADGNILRLCPSSEVHKYGALGATVLIPSMMAYVSMYFYAGKYLGTDHLGNHITVILVALAWSTFILSIDRLLLITYRPLAPIAKRFVQLGVRLLLATFLGVAIAHPICLEQFHNAIEAQRRDVLDKKWKSKTAEIETKMASHKEVYDREIDAASKEKEKLSKVVSADDENPQSIQLNIERQQILTMEASIAKLQKDIEGNDASIETLDEKSRKFIKQANDERYGLNGCMHGKGDSYKKLLKDAADAGANADAKRQANQALKAKVQEDSKEVDDCRKKLKEKELAAGESLQKIQADKIEKNKSLITACNLRIEALKKQKEHTEAQDAKELAKFTSEQEADRARRMDPMQETLALFDVIMPSSADQAQNGYRAFAGFFQFALIFGVFFLVDLIPIVAKMISRGPYDELLHSIEQEIRDEQSIRSTHSKNFLSRRIIDSLSVKTRANLESIHSETKSGSAVGAPGEEVAAAAAAEPDVQTYQR